MIQVTRPRREGSEADAEVWQLRCSRCGKRFTTLAQAYLCYERPAVGGTSEPHWCHKTCVADGATVRLVRADFGLKRLLETLVKPAIPVVKDLRTPRRPWGNP